ncbi:hypothetical protein F5I97DRAFT_1804503 [Phlebopus sp. FC_14]|nr:hypothetical protein F5I97DRAFT_1804503 [Phlebopus sp. FC_14]
MTTASSPHGAEAASGQGDQVVSSAPEGAGTSHPPQTPNATHHWEAVDLDVTPTRSRAQSEVITSTTQFPVPQVEPTPTPVPQEVASVSASTSLEASLTNSQSHQRAETAPATSMSGNGNGAPSTRATATARNKDYARVAGQDAPPGKRQRSPYVKWSKEEDDLLAQAVAKYGQKWDLVQKALPSRGYHQVRQRWLRKLGVFDSKPDLSSFQTAGFPSASRLTGQESVTPLSTPTVSEPPPNPKLGLAPLSSELAFSSLLAGRGESRPPSMSS